MSQPRRTAPASPTRLTWEALHGVDWVPLESLTFMWANSDPIHGAGGWSLQGFHAALENDRQAIAAFITAQPGERARLHGWLEQMELLGHMRDTDPHPRVGETYEALVELGYSGNRQWYSQQVG